MANGFKYAALHKLTCRECGSEFENARLDTEFCGLKCTNAFNGRRMRRGMLLYDFFMQMRYRRAKAAGLWSVLCRMAEEWRAEDEAKRPGFRSWKDPAHHLRRRPYLIGKRGRI